MRGDRKGAWDRCDPSTVDRGRSPSTARTLALRWLALEHVRSEPWVGGAAALRLEPVSQGTTGVASGDTGRA